jgi:transposase
VDAKIKDYLNRLDEAGEREAGVKAPAAEQLEGKIGRLRHRKENHNLVEKRLRESGETQVSLTDPDPRAMKAGQGGDACYNAQIVVDDKHKLILEHEVTSEPTDHHQFATMKRGWRADTF